MNPAVFLEYFNDIQENVQSNFLASIYDEEMIKDIPVFDAEFGFYSPPEWIIKNKNKNNTQYTYVAAFTFVKKGSISNNKRHLLKFFSDYYEGEEH